jgi:7-cyano-7-deazaguanine synthase
VNRRSAVVLLSGGLDSATVLAIARDEGYHTYALSIDYGQRHLRELEAARAVAESLGAVRHLTIRVDLRAIGGSALTQELDVPKNRDLAVEQGIPITYVPARNTVFLALALGFAETIQTFDLFLGANAVDYSGYPDCRPEFIAQFELLANLATKAAVEKQGSYKVHTPLLHWSKAQIIQAGTQLGVDYGLTHSCYAPTAAGWACGQCDSCLLRKKGFAEAGLVDPIRYA